MRNAFRHADARPRPARLCAHAFVAVVVVAAVLGCSRLAAEELVEVEGVPVLAVREAGQVCLSIGRDAEFGSSCMQGPPEDHVNVVATASGLAPKGVIAGRVPSTITEVTIERDGERIAKLEVRDTSYGRFFAAEVPAVDTYRVTATQDSGDVYGSANVEVRADATASAQFDEGATADQ